MCKRKHAWYNNYYLTKEFIFKCKQVWKNIIIIKIHIELELN